MERMEMIIRKYFGKVNLAKFVGSSATIVKLISIEPPRECISIWFMRCARCKMHFFMSEMTGAILGDN
jgi:hypothetical protein